MCCDDAYQSCLMIPPWRGVTPTMESIFHHHQQVSKWQRNWNGQDSFVPCSNPLGDGVDTQSKVPDEQQQKTSDIDERTSTILGVPGVLIYDSESD
nr:hypothetical protein [Tanacetum cinerariifolium]